MAAPETTKHHVGKKVNRRPRLPLAERRSVDGFCYRQDWSLSFFYGMKRKDKTPPEDWVRGKRTISPENEAAYCAGLEGRPPDSIPPGNEVAYRAGLAARSPAKAGESTKTKTTTEVETV
jgi:hypothetical protein